MNIEISPDMWSTLITYGGKIVLALLALLIGFRVIGSITKGIGKTLKKREVDPSLIPFLRSLIGMLLKAALVLAVLGMVGIETTSFIAILGAAGLAVGMALSGTLQNFAGGVMILLFKPFKVGDVLEAQGYIGKVDEIQIFNTIMKTADNRTIIIPNGGLATGSMINYSTEATRRVDFTFGIGYGDSTEKAKEVLMGLINQDARILQDPAPFVAVSELGDSSVNFAVRVWVNSADYWAVFFDMQEKVYNTFNAQGLNIPFPQMDVHVHQA
ncbi:MAG: mechanosensitive ion channel family protein [Bacteroidetes bacterium]|nr:MAG: mechanosensitive ion channel family protein [Bacteroidota bacterium]